MQCVFVLFCFGLQFFSLALVEQNSSPSLSCSAVFLHNGPLSLAERSPEPPPPPSFPLKCLFPSYPPRCRVNYRRLCRPTRGELRMGKVSKFGIFSPAVVGAKVALGETRLNKIRGKVRRGL